MEQEDEAGPRGQVLFDLPHLKRSTPICFHHIYCHTQITGRMNLQQFRPTRGTQGKPGTCLSDTSHLLHLIHYVQESFIQAVVY